MKSLSIFLALVLSATNLFADDTSISKVFIKKSGKDNLYVLQLKDGNAYDYMRYTNKRVYHDFGVYSINHRKIAFESKNRKHGFNSVGGKTFFISKKGIFKTRTNSLLGRDPTLEISDDVIYMNSWDFNPITGKTAADLETEKKTVEDAKTVKALEARKAQMEAYTKTFYLTTAENYGVEYKALLDKNYCGPDCYHSIVNGTIMDWNMDTTRLSLADSYGTVIHESTHSFNGKSYMVIPGIAIPLTSCKTYVSNEFKPLVPADVSKRIFRYDAYVGDSSRVSSNLNGIFGLLDEFTAYQNGTRASVLAAKAALEKGDTTFALIFLSQAKASYFAYYEFNLFIGWYLHYAKTNHPEIFTETMANTNLRIAYTMIDQEFAATIVDLKKTAAAAGEGKNYLSYSESEHVAYPKQLLLQEQPYLTAFAVKGVTHDNYLRFLPEKK